MGTQNDFALAYKLWDFDPGKRSLGMSPSLLSKGLHGTGTTIQDIVNNPGSDAPFALIGTSDKDGDGYINLYQTNDRSGTTNNVKSINPNASFGGSDGGLPTPPAGWDIDDNDPNQGNIAWGTNDTQTLYSTDNITPNAVTDLIVTGLSSQQLPLAWTATADDAPSSGGPDSDKAVHHYDIRYTTEIVIGRYNTNVANPNRDKSCEPESTASLGYRCDIRNPEHWLIMWEFSDCGIRSGEGTGSISANGSVEDINSTPCPSGVGGWNRGEATPLMRALYEDAPKSPGTAENHILQEVTALGEPLRDFSARDPHDGRTSYPNYIADDQLYWVALRSDDGVLQPQIETIDSDGDGVIRNGPFVDAIANGNGLNSLKNTGQSPISNIIAATAGPNGTAITSYSPRKFNPTNPAPVIINGYGLSSTNAATVTLYENNTQKKLTATSIDYSGAPTQIIATFSPSSSGSYPENYYDLEIRKEVITNDPYPITAVWVDAIEVTEYPNEPGVINIIGPTHTIYEDSGNAMILVKRINGSAGTVSINYSTGGQFESATPGEDYIMSSGTLTWADGDIKPKYIPVTIINDSIIEGNEQIRLALDYPVVNGVVDTSILGNINDILVIYEPFSAVYFSYALVGFYAIETESYVAIRVDRTGGFYKKALSVDFSTTDGTATAGQDYTATNGTLSWLDGDTTTKTILVPIIGDAEPESDETFSMTLSNVVGEDGILGSPSTTTATIIDNGARISLSIGSISFEEGAGFMTFLVTRSGDASMTASVDYSTSDGSATAGQDYLATSGTLIFEAFTLGRTFIQVPLLDDSLIENNETLTFALSNPVNATLGTHESTITTIIDDDGSDYGSLQFRLSASDVSEADEVATIVVERVNGTTGTVSVDYATSNAATDSATAGTDYQPASGTLTWSAGDSTAKTILVGIEEDSLIESIENIALNLSNPVGGAALGSNSTATLRIIDNDTLPSNGKLQFSSNNFLVSEAENFINVTVSRVDGSTGSVSIDVWNDTSNPFVNTATVIDDYSFEPTTLYWEDGDSSNRFVRVDIFEDSIVEGEYERILLALANPTGGAELGTVSNTGVVILDNDDPATAPGTLQFSNSLGYSAYEDGIGYATITVTRENGTNGTLTIDYATSNGTATAGTDYTASTGTLTWPDGNTNSLQFTVPVVYDSIEESIETVILTLSNPTLNGVADPTIIGTVSTIQLDIIDAIGTLEFSSPSFSTNEIGGIDATLTVTRTGGNSRRVSVTYITADGTAIASADYQAITGTLTWESRDNSPKTITVPIIDDSEIEEDETFNVTLSNPTAGAKLGSQTSATVTIIDNDSFSSLQFSLASYEVNEDAGVATISVERIGATSGAISVDYTSQAGTASAGSDYLDTSGTLSWADGDSSTKTLTISILDDKRTEISESIILSLSNATGGATLGTNVTATLTIVDNDVKGGGKK